jgi:hypothetical protein
MNLLLEENFKWSNARDDFDKIGPKISIYEHEIDLQTLGETSAGSGNGTATSRRVFFT